MGEIITFFLVVSVGCMAGWARLTVRRRHVIARTTRDWIEFLQEDLSGSTL